MKFKTFNIIEELESQYRKLDISEIFHEKTKIIEKGETTPVSTWPKSWKTTYFKSYPRLKSIKLEKDFSAGIKTSFDKVLYSRLSTRKYGDKLLTLQDISTLLYFSSGIKPQVNQNWDYSRRFYPSGGARYPLETYLVSYNKCEWGKGIYHYNVKEHSLEILKAGNYLKELRKGLDPKWMNHANCALLLTSVFGRNQLKYSSRGYRLILNECGHLTQNTSLICAALNLGCCSLGGYIDHHINNLLDVDGVNESVVYAMIIGSKK